MFIFQISVVKEWKFTVVLSWVYSLVRLCLCQWRSRGCQNLWLETQCQLGGWDFVSWMFETRDIQICRLL